MNRRQFLSFASVPIAAAVVVPELVRTIILPPRGGWPDLSRYFTSRTAWYLKDHPVPYPVRYNNRLLTSADFRRMLAKDLNKFWSDYYDGKILDKDGEPIRFAEDWQAIYGTSG